MMVMGWLQPTLYYFLKKEVDEYKPVLQAFFVFYMPRHRQAYSALKDYQPNRGQCPITTIHNYTATTTDYTAILNWPVWNLPLFSYQYFLNPVNLLSLLQPLLLYCSVLFLLFYTFIWF